MIGRRETLCQNSVRSVQTFRQNSDLWQANADTDRHRTVASTTLAWRRAGKNDARYWSPRATMFRFCASLPHARSQRGRAEGKGGREFAGEFDDAASAAGRRRRFAADAARISLDCRGVLPTWSQRNCTLECLPRLCMALTCGNMNIGNTDNLLC